MSENPFPHPPFSSDPDQTHPWLLVSQGKNHTFCNISNNQHFKKQIPELRNKQVSLSSYGWLLLIDVGKVPLQCCLFNTTSKHKIRLPRIQLEQDHESNGTWFEKCILSKPPGDPDCHVLLIFSDSIFFCRLGDKKFIDATNNIRDDYLSAATNFNGKIYAWMDGIENFVEIDFLEREIILKPLRFTLPLPFGSCCYRNYLVELCGELLLVHKRCHIYNGRKVEYFRIFKVNVLEKKCTELMSIGDHAIFVGVFGSKSVLCTNELSGLKKNSIYYYQKTDRKLYLYDIEDRSKTLVKPCRIDRGKRFLMSWICMIDVIKLNR